ncbi:MAG: hypothetical protein GY909_15865 [Oligoflexia bacterium]|nr:hypothetical protein [Oligoflexia bacterium]
MINAYMQCTGENSTHLIFDWKSYRRIEGLRVYIQELRVKKTDLPNVKVGDMVSFKLTEYSMSGKILYSEKFTFENAA